MNQMGQYLVVKRTKEKDEQFTVIDAMSLDEAHAIFKVRHKDDQDAMEEGETFFIFEVEGNLEFDENNRIAFPKRDMTIIQKW
ncbi:hypothetical protein [Rummeliibacillus pycnus]|uniref:hypothetical protein n=1 Tax=Rummeliibacillus pycnus TaxID=101070 RepID=UPI0037C79162